MHFFMFSAVEMREGATWLTTVGRALPMPALVSRNLREQSVVADPAGTPLKLRAGLENSGDVGVNTIWPWLLRQG